MSGESDPLAWLEPLLDRTPEQWAMLERAFGGPGRTVAVVGVPAGKKIRELAAENGMPFPVVAQEHTLRPCQVCNADIWLGPEQLAAHKRLPGCIALCYLCHVIGMWIVERDNHRNGVVSKFVVGGKHRTPRV